MDGGDRACWWRIRDADYPSRRKWCHPGAVFGLYSDGVGKVRPYRVGGPQMQSILVYSVSPDITEEHPNPSDPDRYLCPCCYGKTSNVSLSFLDIDW